MMPRRDTRYDDDSLDDDAYYDDDYYDDDYYDDDDEGYEYDLTGGECDGRLDLFRAYTYVFENPAWITNLLLLSVVQLIPVIGPIAAMGYQFEVMDSLLRWPHRSYPDFDFDRLGEYLARGVWPFLVVFLVSLVVFPFLYLAFIIAALAGLVGAAEADDPVLLIVVFGVLLVLFVVALCVFGLVSRAMALRAGLAEDFSAGFQMHAVFGFVSRVWLESILETIFLMLTAPLLVFAGLLLCFVGVLPASGLILLAQAHLNYQAYQLDLYRGGIPVRLSR